MTTDTSNAKPEPAADIIDRRLEFLYQRRETAHEKYMTPDWKDLKEWHRSRKEYFAADEAYSVASKRYNREAPSVRNMQPETAADVATRCPRCECEWGSEEIERDTCFACGWENGGEFETDMLLCPECGGTGANDPNFDGWDDEGWLPCEACNGTGMIGIK